MLIKKISIIHKDPGLLFFLAIVVVIMFYSFGNFGFLNIFDARLPIQITLLSTTGTLFILFFMIYFKKLINEPIFLLVVSFIIMDLFIRFDIKSVIANVITMIVISFILMVKVKYIHLILKGIIYLALIFSLMSILLYIIIINNELDVNSIFISTYFSGSGNDYIPVSNYEYLGFLVNDSGSTLFGQQVYRFKAFASEPSVLVYSILTPGILAIYYKKYLSFSIIMFFSIFLVLSGTIIMSIFLGILFYIAYMLGKRNAKISTGIIWSFLFFFIIFIFFINVSDFMNNVIEFMKVSSSISSMPIQKYNSGVIRLSGLQEAITQISFFGSDSIDHGATGFIIVCGLKSGIIGIVLNFIIFSKLFIYMFTIIKHNKIMLSLLGGVLIQVQFFSAYGWSSFTGLIMITIIYRIIKNEYLNKTLLKEEIKLI